MREIEKTCVFGAGAMGQGIAQVFAHAGCDVTVIDISADALKSVHPNIEANLKLLSEYNLCRKADISQILDRIHTATELPSDSGFDFVIEAVPEDLDLKQKVLSSVENQMQKDAILATTTSVIQISDIVSGLQKPEQFVGTHWMNPPYVLPLVEIIPGQETNNDVVASTKSFLEDKCGKKTVTCGDAPGFLINRMAAAVLVEAAKMVEQGIATFEDIDRAWKEHMGYIFLQFGPFGNIDHIGLDVITMAANYLAFVLDDERFRPPSWLQEKVTAGELGTKTGKGIYDYSGRTPDDMRMERVRKLLELLQCRDI